MSTPHNLGTADSPEAGHELFEKASLQILGLARQFDFMIRLFGEDAYTRLSTVDRTILAVYAHEWTHYFQFLSQGSSQGSDLNS